MPGGLYAAPAFATLLALVVITMPNEGLAQQSSAAIQDQSIEELSEQVNDPTASLTKAQIKEEFTPAEFGTNAQPNTLLFRPILAVLPHGPMDLEQIVRPTFSLLTVARGKGASTHTALGDTQLLDLVVMPWPDVRETGFRWGIGPYFVLPTATSHRAGQSAWQAGIGLAFRFRPTPGLLISALAQQATSFAYTSPRASPVTFITFQPMLSYRLGHGWYVRSSDATWRFNFRHGTSSTIPVSAGLGKVWEFPYGGAINTSVAGEWMVYRQYSPRAHQFTLKFQVTYLLPKVRL